MGSLAFWLGWVELMKDPGKTMERRAECEVRVFSEISSLCARLLIG